MTELRTVHVLPYTIRSDSYDGYSHRVETTTHGEGELVVDNIEDLAPAIISLMSNFIDEWTNMVGTQFGFNPFKKFKFDRWSDYTERYCKAPMDDMKYPLFGKYRIELRPIEEGGRVDLDDFKHVHDDTIRTSVDSKLAEAYKLCDDCTPQKAKSIEEQLLAEKRRTYERLKAELGKLEVNLGD